MYVCMYAYMHRCISVCMCVCMYVSTSTKAYICIGYLYWAQTNRYKRKNSITSEVTS